jgi:hypothetical protein
MIDEEYTPIRPGVTIGWYHALAAKIRSAGSGSWALVIDGRPPREVGRSRQPSPLRLHLSENPANGHGRRARRQLSAPTSEWQIIHHLVAGKPAAPGRRRADDVHTRWVRRPGPGGHAVARARAPARSQSVTVMTKASAESIERAT